MTDAQPEFNPHKVGDRVSHSTWGAGTVSDVDGIKTSVSFDGGGFRRVLCSFLKPSDKPAPQAANNNAPLPFINPANWHGETIPPRQWYVPDLIPMRQVTLLSGDGGVGKSLLALQITAAGAMSVETLDMVPWAGRVLYLGAEDEVDEFHRRLADISKSLGGDLSDLHLFRLLPMADMDALLSVPDKAGVMQPTPLWRDFADYATGYKPKLIVLDTAADLYGGDEIKRGQVRQFISMLRKLAIAIDCAIVLLAHPSVQGMQTGTGLSGSTGWGNSVRSRLYLTADKDDPDRRVLTTKKANYGKVGGEIKLRWRDGAFVLDDGKPSAAAGLIASKADEVFLRLLSATNGSGQKVSPSRSPSYAPTVMSKRPDRDGMSKQALEEAMHRHLASSAVAVVTEGSPSRQRQRLVVVADEVAQGRAEGLPSNGTFQRSTNALPTPSNGCAHTPPVPPVPLEGTNGPLEDGPAPANDNDVEAVRGAA